MARSLTHSIWKFHICFISSSASFCFLDWYCCCWLIKNNIYTHTHTAKKMKGRKKNYRNFVSCCCCCYSEWKRRKRNFFITKKINKIKRHTLKISIGTAHHCVVVDLLWCWPYYTSYENTEITLLCDNKESCNRCLPTTIINHYFYPLIWNTEWYTTKKSNNNNKKQSCPKSMILNSKKRSIKKTISTLIVIIVFVYSNYTEKKNPAHFNEGKKWTINDHHHQMEWEIHSYKLIWHFSIVIEIIFPFILILWNDDSDC